MYNKSSEVTLRAMARAHTCGARKPKFYSPGMHSFFSIPKIRYVLPVLFALMPLQALAGTQVGFLGTLAIFLYGVIGFFGALSILAYCGGFILYIVRLGTEHRRAGIIYMEWAVIIMFVVVILIFILRWIS